MHLKKRSFFGGSISILCLTAIMPAVAVAEENPASKLAEMISESAQEKTTESRSLDFKIDAVEDALDRSPSVSLAEELAELRSAKDIADAKALELNSALQVAEFASKALNACKSDEEAEAKVDTLKKVLNEAKLVDKAYQARKSRMVEAVEAAKFEPQDTEIQGEVEDILAELSNSELSSQLDGLKAFVSRQLSIKPKKPAKEMSYSERLAYDRQVLVVALRAYINYHSLQSKVGRSILGVPRHDVVKSGLADIRTRELSESGKSVFLDDVNGVWEDSLLTLSTMGDPSQARASAEAIKRASSVVVTGPAGVPSLQSKELRPHPKIVEAVIKIDALKKERAERLASNSKESSQWQKSLKEAKRDDPAFAKLKSQIDMAEIFLNGTDRMLAAIKAGRQCFAAEADHFEKNGRVKDMRSMAGHAQALGNAASQVNRAQAMTKKLEAALRE